MSITVSLTKKQLATARAALQLWHEGIIMKGDPPASPEFEKVEPLTSDEVDDLYHLLKTSELGQRPKHQLKAPTRYRVVFTCQGTINGSAETTVYAMDEDQARRIAEDYLRDGGAEWSYDPVALPDFDDTSAQVESVELFP